MKISRFMIIFSTICVLVIVVISVTTMRITDEHEQKLIYAMQSKVEYYAKRCFLEEKCKGEVTLETLYENEYLTEVSHPVTKEILDPNLKINYENNKVVINW